MTSRCDAAPERVKIASIRVGDRVIVDDAPAPRCVLGPIPTRHRISTA